MRNHLRFLALYCIVYFVYKTWHEKCCNWLCTLEAMKNYFLVLYMQHYVVVPGRKK